MLLLKNMNLVKYLKEMWRGKDIYRILMNAECSEHSLSGVTLDVGSGENMASYHRFLKRKPDVEVMSLDLHFVSDGNEKQFIDLEKDALPKNDSSVDTVLLFNFLEHIYNYSHVFNEIKRVLKPNGTLIGAVPFLVAYHPDPHDYWRYTKETLEKIFTSAGFMHASIKSFGCGPATAAFSQFEVVCPRILKMFLFPIVFLLDSIIVRLRPQFGKEKFSLGLFFEVSP